MKAKILSSKTYEAKHLKSVRPLLLDGFCTKTAILPANSLENNLSSFQNADYRIDCMVKRGNINSIYRAHKLAPKYKENLSKFQTESTKIQTKSIKILNPTYTDSYHLERFFREIKFLLNAKHENILKCDDFGYFNSSPFMVCEYIEGTSLSYVIKLINTGKRITLASFMKIAKGLLKALEYISFNPDIMAHRDIKPANIMLRENFNPVLIDFNSAHTKYKVFCNLKTLSIGTAKYMAPEQRQCPDSSDIVSDIFSLGMVLSELSMGLNESEKKSIIPLLDKMCREKRGERFSNPAEIYEELEVL